MDYLSKYSHIIWDWNGTLLNDLWLCVKICNILLAKHQLPLVDEEIFRKHYTHPMTELYRSLGFDLENNPFEQLAEEFHTEYEANFHNIRLHHNTLDVLSRIKNSGKTQSILSAHPNYLLNESTKIRGINTLFTEIIGLPDKLAGSKIDIGKKWLDKSHINPGTTVLIGDTAHDLETANALSVDCILIAGGFQSIDFIKSLGCLVLEEIGILGEFVP